MRNKNKQKKNADVWRSFEKALSGFADAHLFFISAFAFKAHDAVF